VTDHARESVVTKKEKTMTAPDHLAVAAALFDSIESGDVESVRQIYTEDAVIWHNHDGVEQSVEDNMRSLDWVVRNLSGAALL
jgi:ketosteroid isomerase-like protein